jgi:hemerythrin
MGAYVAWKPYYSVGEPSLDAQHKQILSILDDLYAAINAGREHEQIAVLLDRMVLYTMSHFKHEEQVMQECSYPDFENHKGLHDGMRRRTAGLRTNVDLVTGRDLLCFLKDWWISHIQGEDKCYVPYLSAAARKGQSTAAPAQSVGPVDWLGQTPARQ